MKNIYIKDIINICDGNLIFGNINDICTNFTINTKETLNKDTFIGIKGNNIDSNLLYNEAWNNGIKTCILDKNSLKDINFKEIKNKNLIIVDDTIKTLKMLAKYKRSLYDIPVIAITGSVGKTSTKDMLSCIMKKKYKVLTTQGNQNGQLGLPLTILKLKDEEMLILEMGMSKFKEMSLLTDIAKPNVVAITNIGTSHIGNLGSRENILKAKLEILEGLDQNGVLFLNNDDDLLHNEISKLEKNYNIITIGINNKSKYLATNISNNLYKTTFNIKNDKIKLNIGSYNYIYNSLLAYAICKYYNISSEHIIKGLNEFKPSKNRLEKIINNSGTTIINDTYNASYESIKNAIEIINNSNYKRKILLLADILELGNYKKKIHTNIGKELINTNIDIIITIGNASKYIYDEVKDIKEAYHFNNQEEICLLLKKMLNKDDIILLKGSHGMNLINIVNIIKEY